MNEDNPSARIKKRVVLHFPGFEPLDAAKHHARYKRTALKTAELWDFKVDVGSLHPCGRYFDVESEGENWQTSTRVHILDHHDLVRQLNDRPTLQRLGYGFLSAARVIGEGGATQYFRHAWRFALFFAFPFVLVSIAMVASLAVAVSPHWFGLHPWIFILSLSCAYILFFRLFLPWSERLLTLHLFADWELAVAVARLNEPYVDRLLNDCLASARAAFNQTADEYVVSSHSMGSSIATHVVGMLLEQDTQFFEGKRVVFATLGGAILQCALLRCAEILRTRIGTIAHAREIVWFDVQCLTDAINFYKCSVVGLAGHHEARQPRLAFIRLKRMLSTERYRKIKWDFLRVHRQYVLDADVRAPFDFTLMTAGPYPAESFVDRPGLL